jgi:hypothetical protein
MTGSPTRHNRPLFFDINTGGRAIRDAIAQSLGVEVVLHNEHFGEPKRNEKSPDDREWLVAIGKLGWIIVTADARCIREPLFLYDIGKSDALVFILADLNCKTRDARVQLVVESYPVMIASIEGASRPAIWILEGGKLTSFDWRTRLAQYHQWGRIRK